MPCGGSPADGSAARAPLTVGNDDAAPAAGAAPDPAAGGGAEPPTGGKAEDWVASDGFCPAAGVEDPFTAGNGEVAPLDWPDDTAGNAP